MSDDVIRMQQEAANRVQRMQERSRRLVTEAPPLYGDIRQGRTREPEPPAAVPVPAERRTVESLEQQRREAEQARQIHHVKQPREEKGLASLFNGDQDQMLLLMLAVLLVKNGANIELIVALLYLAM